MTFSKIFGSKIFGSKIFSGFSIAITGLVFSINASANNFSTGTFTVDINKTQIMHLPSAASAVVVGNPDIADVSVHSPTILFIVGRGSGTTNVIVLDALGQTIANTDIHVKTIATPSNRRVFLAGQGWNTYDCAPFCQPSPGTGDAPDFAGKYSAQGMRLNNTGVPATITPFGPAGMGGMNQAGISGSSSQPTSFSEDVGPAMQMSRTNRYRMTGAME